MTRPMTYSVGWIGIVASMMGFSRSAVAGDEPKRDLAAGVDARRIESWDDSYRYRPTSTAAGSFSEDPPGLVRLAKDFDVWMDPIRKYVVVDGHVCLRRGQLEMFACPKGTKEHESIVAVNSPARFVHAGLLAVGAEKGTPVRFEPEYRPASGTEIEVWVLWIDQQGTRRKVRAQEWVRDIRNGTAMTFQWVFAGSGFWKDEESGEQHYLADGGDFICVSNFTTATLDLTVESSASTAGLLFEAFTDNIPNQGTHVRLVLIPQKRR